MWKEERRSYSLELPPDERALAFLEWVDMHPGEVAERTANRYDDPRNWAAAEARALQEAVPF